VHDPSRAMEGGCWERIEEEEGQGKERRVLLSVRRESGGGPVHAYFSLPIRGEPALFYVASTPSREHVLHSPKMALS
jgi:hypothetical protein